MNRLILIGNGFDLANGFKTRYADFFYDYMYQVFSNLIVAEKIISNNETIRKYQDENITIFTTENILNGIKLSSIEDFIFGYPKINFSDISINWKNKLLEDLFDSFIEKRWVDIETHYQTRLVRVLKDWDVYNKHSIAYIGIILKENYWIENVQKLLVNYLSKLKFHITSATDDFLVRFYDKIDMESLAYKNDLIVKDKLLLPGEELETGLVDPKKIMLLNFNCTSALDSVFNKHNSSKCETINIHGEIDNDKNPIVFGLGDEYDKYYTVLEEFGNNAAIRNSKSFHYSQTSNYSKLVSFVEGEDYQIQIFGHSCGKSDRTLLKYLFENKYCRQIKIYPKDRDDFFEKTMEISRHFSDKSIMRMKVASYDENCLCPQAKRPK